MQPHLARYEFVIQNIHDVKNALDIACGTGYGVLMYKIQGYSNVYGADLDFSAVKYASDNYPSVKYVQADGITLPFISDTFDLITSFETFEHMLEPRKYLTEICRLIKPEGMFIISVPNAPIWAPFSQPPDITKDDVRTGLGHKYNFTADQFLCMLADYFTSVNSYGQDFRKRSFLSKVFRQLERFETLISYRAAAIGFIRNKFRSYLKDVIPQEDLVFSDKKWQVKPWVDTRCEPLFCVAICKDKKA
jgi:SAM-dependent methyltransferase